MKIKFREEYKKNIFFVIGCIILFFLFIFYLIQGENIFVLYHDQLDSEVISYMLRTGQINSFFQTSFENLMNGSAEVGVSAIFELIIYYLFAPVYAYIINMFIVRMVAFGGMYLLLKKLCVDEFLCFLVGMTFAMLPIYSAYGLSSMGVPLLALCLWNLYKKERICGSLIYIMLYVLYSSLILVGFAILSILFIISAVLIIRKRKDVIWFYFGSLELLVLYFITNIQLIISMFGNTDFISHKSDIILTSSSFFDSFFTLLKNGQYHVASVHNGIWFVMIVYIFLFFISRKNLDEVTRKKSYLIVLLFASIILIAVFFGFFLSATGVAIRNNIFEGSALKSFQFHRFHWLYPALWYTLLGLMLSCIFTWIKGYKYIRKAAYVLACIIWMVPGAIVFLNSDVIKNVYHELPDSDIDVVTWKSFFSEDLFDDINDYIGQDKSEYKVISVGLYPSIPLYNGYYCLDGYSNNYDLDYKYEFLEVIAEELENNDSEYDYYMNWGSRCYAFSADLGKNYLVGKKSQRNITSYLNTEKLKSMGCKYVFSTVPIVNHEDIGMNFENYFETDSSYYGIFLYQMK